MNADFLTNMVSRMEETKEKLSSITEQKTNFEKVVKIDPNEIANWEYRDRQNFELGDLEALAESIEQTGQAQPIILVLTNSIFKSEEQSTKYIVIAGYRRWLACKNRNIPVDAIIREMNFEQAVACLVSENEKEKVSDYSKGMFYFHLLKREGVTRKSLYERLGINKGVFDNYLSFSEVPKEIWDAVGCLKNISARTSATIKLIAKKGDAEKKALITIADKISMGIGEKKITSLVHKIISTHNLIKAVDNLRISFSENIIMETKGKSIKVKVTKLDNEKVGHLSKIIEKAIEKFVSEIS